MKVVLEKLHIKTHRGRSWEQFKEQQQCLLFWRSRYFILLLMYRDIFSKKSRYIVTFFKAYFVKLKRKTYVLQ